MNAVRFPTLLATLALVCALATAVSAEPPHSGPPGPPPEGEAWRHDGRPGGHGGPPHGPPPVEVLGAEAERLGLDQETRDEIKAIVKESRTHADEIRSKVRDEREQMRELLSNPDVEESAVMRQAEEIGTLELEEHKNWLRAMLRIRALLTPEQRKELIKLREEMFTEVFKACRSACSDDIAKLCPDAEGDETTRACMRRHREELSARCREAIAAELAKRRPFPRGGER